MNIVRDGYAREDATYHSPEKGRCNVDYKSHKPKSAMRKTGGEKSLPFYFIPHP